VLAPFAMPETTQKQITANAPATEVDVIELKIPPWNMAVYMQATHATLNIPYYHDLRKKYGMLSLVIFVLSAFFMVWLLKNYAMPINPWAFLACSLWGAGMMFISVSMLKMAQLQTMQALHADFAEGYQMHLNLTNGLIAFVTPSSQVFVKKQDLELIAKIGESFIFRPRDALMLYHLPQSVLAQHERTQEIQQFFNEKFSP